MKQTRMVGQIAAISGLSTILLYAALQVGRVSGSGPALNAAAPYVQDTSGFYTTAPGLVRALPPSLANFSWLNQGSAALTTGTYGDENILLASTDTQMRSRVINVPNGTWTVTATFIIDQTVQTSCSAFASCVPFAGLVMIDTLGTNPLGPDMIYCGTIDGIGCYYTNGYQMSSGPGTSILTAAAGTWFYLAFVQIHYDGTNLTFYSAASKASQPPPAGSGNWVQQASVAASTYFPTSTKPTKIGWGAYGAATTGGLPLPVYEACLSWSLTQP